MNCEQSTSKILWDNLSLNIERLKRISDSINIEDFEKINIKEKIDIIRVKIVNFNYYKRIVKK